MKDLLTDALQKKVSAALSATGGVNALYGEPVKIGNDEVVPVGRIAIELSANAQGGGSGKTGVAALSKLSAAPSGGGEGDAAAGVRIVIEPVGYLRAGANGPEFVRLD